ncbi:sulfotransferase family cytosolic 1B member 1-like [Alligator sinensis]|uniref:Sulfotransferase n=1 Tax=Alligator sinensis TaxID=38654 RepID=A0A3Q0FTS3_ALLSI|nr:sulfotransferase family cytosolic 1B member 1-like [Alligator sinensis]
MGSKFSCHVEHEALAQPLQEEFSLSVTSGLWGRFFKWRDYFGKGVADGPRWLGVYSELVPRAAGDLGWRLLHGAIATRVYLARAAGLSDECSFCHQRETLAHLVLECTPPPRVIKTHLPIQLVPKSFWDNDCKVIYVARNPKDTVVSYYFFDQKNKTQPEPGPWPTYLQRFMRGELAWGSWYDHVCGYWAAREKHRILYVFYEDMKEDPGREVQQVASFLGAALSPEALARVIQLSSFTAMQDNPMANYSSVPRALFDPTISPFLRRGEVGDWKNHFTVAQNEAFDAHYQNRMASPGVPHFRSQV